MGRRSEEVYHWGLIAYLKPGGSCRICAYFKRGDGDSLAFSCTLRPPLVTEIQSADSGVHQGTAQKQLLGSLRVLEHPLRLGPQLCSSCYTPGPGRVTTEQEHVRLKEMLEEQKQGSDRKGIGLLALSLTLALDLLFLVLLRVCMVRLLPMLMLTLMARVGIRPLLAVPFIRNSIVGRFEFPFLALTFGQITQAQFFSSPKVKRFGMLSFRNPDVVNETCQCGYLRVFPHNKPSGFSAVTESRPPSF